MSQIDGYVPDRAEFVAAAERITATTPIHGGKEPAAVAWLLTFAQGHALELAPSAVETTLQEVLRFQADAGQGGADADYGQSGGFRFRPPDTLENKRVALSLLQEELWRGVSRYIDVGVVSFPTCEAGVTVARGYRSVLFSGRTIEAGVYYMAGQLLARYGHRVKRCEGCSVIMLTGRSDQRFHSKGCQILTFVRRKRAEDKAKRTTRKTTRGGRQKKAKRTHKPKGGKHGTTR